MTTVDMAWCTVFLEYVKNRSHRVNGPRVTQLNESFCSTDKNRCLKGIAVPRDYSDIDILTIYSYLR